MLQISELTKSYNKKFALDAVSLIIPKGEIYGLLGPNGAGKTTFIRIVNQIIAADSGIIRFDGQLMSSEHLRHIGYLPEERGLYKNMCILDHLVFLGKLRGLSSSEAIKNSKFWLDKLAISEWSNKKIEALSKGMAQKVQFIASLVHNPDLLILDEPLSGFDPVNVELILKELKELKANGKTILLSTHNMRSVEEICDRATLIHDAKILVEDTVWNLREKSKKGTYSIRFKGNMIAFVNALWTDFELLEQTEIGEQRFLTLVKMRGERSMNDLLNALMGEISIEAIEECFPSMQEVFIELIQGKESSDEK